MIGGGGFAPVAALAGGKSLVLAHAGLGGAVGAPGAAPAPPPAGIALNAGELGGAEIWLGESCLFAVAVTTTDGALPIERFVSILAFVSVENHGPGRATVTVDASSESAFTG